MKTGAHTPPMIDLEEKYASSYAKFAAISTAYANGELAKSNELISDLDGHEREQYQDYKKDLLQNNPNLFAKGYEAEKAANANRKKHSLDAHEVGKVKPKIRYCNML